MRSHASPASARQRTSSCDPASVDRDRLRRRRSSLRRPRARRRPAGARLLALRVRARRPLPRLPGARRRAVRARRLRDRVPARARRSDRACARPAEAEIAVTRLRYALFAAGACGLGLLLVWGVSGLPDFGHYAGPYGDIVSKLAEPQRHIANA